MERMGDDDVPEAFDARLHLMEKKTRIRTNYFWRYIPLDTNTTVLQHSY